ncbi:hypothetical protein K2X92_01060 [Candidatus Gracilibacteria bacterium]|nr:hypothetical protein [Candidatus Gracilibacteria bacterium]
MTYDITYLIFIAVICVLIYRHRAAAKKALTTLDSLKKENMCLQREVLLFKKGLIEIDFRQFRWDTNSAISDSTTSTLRFISTEDHPSASITIHAVSNEDGSCRILPGSFSLSIKSHGKVAHFFILNYS